MSIEPLIYSLSGFLMKLSDDAYDIKKNIRIAVLAGIFCSLLIGYLTVTTADAACIFVSILIGTLLSMKIDSLNHIIALLLFILIIFYIGIPSIGIFTLLFCSVAAFLDEIGNDNKWIQNKKNIKKFFTYRFTLKTMVMIFVILGFFQNIFPILKISDIQYFQFQTFIYFILFDLFYEIAGLKFNTIYNGINSFFRIIRRID
ncbi:MAG: hypothetical protein PHY59_04230 [Methanobacterium sp.]|nr:hypothetical protein [Methanobacterium sp.]